MRKKTTIVLLLVFIGSQYARQLAYVECRLANYLIWEKAGCDCDKILEGNVPESSDTPVPVMHRHFQLDEQYFPSAFITQEWIRFFTDSKLSGFSSYLSEGFCSTPDHPPPGC